MSGFLVKLFNLNNNKASSIPSKFKYPTNPPLLASNSNLAAPNTTLSQRRPSLPPYPFHEFPFGPMVSTSLRSRRDSNFSMNPPENENHGDDDNPFSDGNRASVSTIKKSKSLSFSSTAAGQTSNSFKNYESKYEEDDDKQSSPDTGTNAFSKQTTPQSNAAGDSDLDYESDDDLYGSNLDDLSAEKHNAADITVVSETPSRNVANASEHEMRSFDARYPLVQVYSDEKIARAVHFYENFGPTAGGAQGQNSSATMSSSHLQTTVPGPSKSKVVRPISLSSETSAASSSAFTYTTGGASEDLAVIERVPTQSAKTVQGRPKAVRPISLASETSAASSNTNSLAEQVASIASVNDDASSKSAYSSSTTRPRRDSISSTNSSATLTQVGPAKKPKKNYAEMFGLPFEPVPPPKYTLIGVDECHDYWYLLFENEKGTQRAKMVLKSSYPKNAKKSE